MSFDRYKNLYNIYLTSRGTSDVNRLHQVVADCNQRKSWDYDNSECIQGCSANKHSWYQFDMYTNCCHICYKLQDI